jgi:hypothetical protein
MGGDPRGAYGFRLVPTHDLELPDLVGVEEAAESVALECRHATALVDRLERTEESIVASSRESSLIEVHRDPLSITLALPNPTTPEELVHPVLTMPISILARWRGDLTLHAGCFYAGDRAWGVMGPREAGKSTMLANLAEREVPLLADDLLVFDQGVVHPGPSCIDLRPDVAERMPEARFLGEINDRARYRLTTPPPPSRPRLGGFFLLSWGEEERVEVTRMEASEALRVLYEQEYIGLLGPADPLKILDLLGTPMWRVERPPNWRFTEETLDRILEVAAAGAVTG